MNCRLFDCKASCQSRHKDHRDALFLPATIEGARSRHETKPDETYFKHVEALIFCSQPIFRKILFDLYYL